MRFKISFALVEPHGFNNLCRLRPALKTYWQQEDGGCISLTSLPQPFRHYGRTIPSHVSHECLWSSMLMVQTARDCPSLRDVPSKQTESRCCEQSVMAKYTIDDLNHHRDT